MRFRGCLHNREAETRTAGVARTGLVETHEALEDSLPVLGSDAGSIVSYRQYDLTVRPVDVDVYRRGCMPTRIVEEVVDGALERAPAPCDRALVECIYHYRRSASLSAFGADTGDTGEVDGVGRE